MKFISIFQHFKTINTQNTHLIKLFSYLKKQIIYFYQLINFHQV